MGKNGVWGLHGLGKSMRIGVIVLVGLALMGALSACASNGANSSGLETGSSLGNAQPWVPASTSGSAPPVESADALLRAYGPAPLAAYNSSSEWNLRQINAWGVLVTECMARVGFSYTPKEPESSVIPGTDWDDFLGVTDMAIASSNAYRSAQLVALDNHPTVDQQKKQDGEIDTISDPAYLAALWGDASARMILGLPEDKSLTDDFGCDPMAMRRMAPAAPKPNMEIQGEAWRAAKATAQADPAVRAALQNWRSCMRQAGYQLESIPLPGDSPITPEAVAQAKADVTCKSSSGLTKTYIETLYAAERAQISRRKAEFDAFQSYQDARDRLAAEVLAGR